MARQCKPAVFGLMLTIAATAAACPAGWTPSPNASWANQCFGVPAGRSSSLRSCVELCGAEGGVPACVASAEENGFVGGAARGRLRVARPLPERHERWRR